MGSFQPEAGGKWKLRSVLGGRVTKFPENARGGWAMDVLQVTSLLVDPAELVDAKSDAVAKLYQGLDRVQELVKSSVPRRRL